MRFQIEVVQGYDKDQVDLIIPDLTTFAARVPVTLGTPTINWSVNVIKESEIDELSISLNELSIYHLLAGGQAEHSLKNDITASETPGLTDLNEAAKTAKWEDIEAFSSKILHGHMKTVLLGNNMYVMTKGPEMGEEPCLSHGLSMVNTYTEMTSASRHIPVVIKNQTAVPILLARASR